MQAPTTTTAPLDTAAARPTPLAFHAFLTLAMALPMLVFYAVGALAPVFIRDLGLTPAQLGPLTTASFGLAALLSLVAGPWVRRQGARRALWGLFVSVALAFFLAAVLPGFWGLVAALAVCGVAQSLANPATNLLIGQRVAPASKAFAVGLKQAGVQMSAIAAGVVLPPLAATIGWRWSLLAVVPLALLLALVTGRFAPAARPPAAPGGTLARPNRPAAWLMAIQACVGAALAAFVTYAGLFAIEQGASPTVAGALLAAFGVLGIAARVVLTPLAARLGEEASIAMLAVLAASSVLVLSQAGPTQHALLWLGAIGMGATAVAVNAIGMSLVVRDTRFGATAEVSGLLAAAFFSGLALGPLLVGHLVDGRWRWSAAWGTTAALLLAAALIAWRLALLRRPEAAVGHAGN